MAQVAEHILGKDEVTSSNLVISSINPRKLRVCGDFCCSDFEENGRKCVALCTDYAQMGNRVKTSLVARLYL